VPSRYALTEIGGGVRHARIVCPDEMGYPYSLLGRSPNAAKRMDARQLPHMHEVAG